MKMPSGPVSLLAIPVIDWEVFGDIFQLPVAEPLNCGGFRFNAEVCAYSPIDLVVAGLEEISKVNPKSITNLAQWFDANRNCRSKHWVKVYIYRGRVECLSVAEIQSENNLETIKLMNLNAPLSMKWR